MTAAVITYDAPMVRWDPDSRGRLAQAAMELYLEHGYDRTTVAEIAQRAGLTERTFFRHFADKREVLFDGSHALQSFLVDGVTAAPPGSPVDALARALEGAGARFQEVPERVRARQVVIDANPELQERELIKLATLAGALAEALRARDVPEPAASLAAEAGIAVFKVAFARWVHTEGADLPGAIRDSFDVLRAVTAA